MSESTESTASREADVLLLVDNAQDFAMIFTDPERRIVRWMAGAEHLLGWTEAEALGQLCDIIFTPEDRAVGAPAQEAETALREGRAEDERWHQRKDGSRFWGSGVKRPLYDEAGILRGFGKVMRDLTPRKRLEDELRQTREELEKRVAKRTEQLSSALSALEKGLAERQALTRRLVDAQEEERRRISRDLHDEMGQLLTGFSLGLKSLEGAVSAHCPVDSGAGGMLERLRATAEQMGREVHRLAVELRPTSLDDLGLLPALESYVEEWGARTGVRAEFVAIGAANDRFLPLVETTVYRVVQEAMNNAAKYAVPGGATRLDVTLQRIVGHLQVTIEDDGPGFDVEEVAARSRLGIAGMRERAELIGGSLEVESTSGEGTIVFLRVPVKPDRI